MMARTHRICIQLLLLHLKLLLQRVCTQLLYHKLMLWLGVCGSNIGFINHRFWNLYLLYLRRWSTLSSYLRCRFLLRKLSQLLISTVDITFLFFMLFLFTWTPLLTGRVIFVTVWGLIHVCIVRVSCSVLLPCRVLLLGVLNWIHLDRWLLHVKIHVQSQISCCWPCCLLHDLLLFQSLFVYGLGTWQLFFTLGWGNSLLLLD